MMLQAISFQDFLTVGGMTLMLVLALFGMTRSRNKQMEDAKKDIYELIDKVAKDANKRIDDIREDYVHKDRLQDVMANLARSIDGLRDEIRDNHKRMDRIFELAIAKAGNPGKQGQL